MAKDLPKMNNFSDTTSAGISIPQLEEPLYIWHWDHFFLHQIFHSLANKTWRSLAFHSPLWNFFYCQFLRIFFPQISIWALSVFLFWSLAIKCFISWKIQSLMGFNFHLCLSEFQTLFLVSAFSIQHLLFSKCFCLFISSIAQIWQLIIFLFISLLQMSSLFPRVINDLFFSTRALLPRIVRTYNFKNIFNIFSPFLDWL